MAGYNSDNHPSVQFSPDGSGWTIIDELPYMEDPYCLGNDTWQPCWTQAGEKIETAIVTNLPNPGKGQHTYRFDRTGMVPVDYWLVEWDRGKCIHGCLDPQYRGFTNLVKQDCWQAYWSGSGKEVHFI